MRGRLPGSRRRKDAIELYDSKRCLTLTGWHLVGSPFRIEERQEELERFYAYLFREEEQYHPTPVQAAFPIDASDAELIERAMRARNGVRFGRLWSGSADVYDGDQSRADLALCGILAFWTGGDAERMDRLYRRSGLFRDKWDERRGVSTYGQRTIARALAGRIGTYTSAGQKPTAPDLLAATQERSE
jgi:putative DNA primase/helicase